ncbi:MAG: guanylate kinase [Ignavibacteriales bacterium]
MRVSKRRGLLIVISGPSGSGKGTICDELLNKRKDLCISTSATTRSPRTNDIDGITYFFKTEQEFKDMIEKDELLEWVKYCDNYYGTPKKNLESKLDEGKDVILEIDVVGGLKVKSKYPESILVFILPPSFKDLLLRLKCRGTEDEELMNKRIKKAVDEIEYGKKYDYFVRNDTIENAVMKIDKIIDSEKCSLSRNLDKFSEFIVTIKEVF